MPNILNYTFNYSYNGTRPHAPDQIGNWAYEYDANGNVIKKVRLAGSTGNSSQTDRKNDGSQKEDKSHGQGNGWAYGSENLDNNKNKVRKDNGNHSDSDIEGGGNSGEFTWDEENRLVVAKDTGNGQSTYFLYDYQGDRTIKRGQGGETLYVNQYYQLQNQDIITKHIFVGNTRIVSKLTHYDTYDSVYEKQNIYTYHPDHLGSSNFVSDYAGNEFEHMEYTPYGESWVDEGTNKNVIGYRFTGKELDDETGLYYYGARYLDPVTSRWISSDPAMEKYLPEEPVDEEAVQRNSQLPGQGGVFNPVNLNVYAYSYDNPIKYSDPDGCMPQWLNTALTKGGNFAAGINESLSFGLSSNLVELINGSDPTDRSSGEYLSGQATALIGSLVLSGGSSSAVESGTAAKSGKTVKNAIDHIDLQFFNNKSKAIDLNTSIEKQLAGKGQLKDLRSNPNLKGVNIGEILKKTPAEVEKMVKEGEFSQKAWKTIRKAFEGRDLGGRNGG